MKNLFRNLVISILLGYPLYIPLRFQFNNLSIIPAILFLLTVSAFIIASNRDIMSNIKATQLDQFIFAYFIYTVMLCFYADSYSEILKYLRSMALPITFYYIGRTYSYLFDNSKIIKVILFTSLIVSVFFLIELISVVILKQGYFAWTNLYRDYVMSQGTYDISASYIAVGEGEFYTRIAGILGHNHNTSYFMGLGAIGFYILFKESYKGKYKYFFMIGYLFCLSTTILSLARTSIISIIAGFILVFIYLQKKNVSSNKVLFIITLILLPLELVLEMFSTFSLYNYFIAAADSLTSFDGVIRYKNVIANISEFDQFVEQIVTSPISFIFGIGFSFRVKSEDLFLLSFFSAYGIIGLSLFSLIIKKGFDYFQYVISNYKSDYVIILMPIAIILTGLISTLHSSTLISFQIYPIFYFALGLINSQYVKQRFNTNNIIENEDNA